MKRRILPLLLSLLLCMGLVSPALMADEVTLIPLPDGVYTFGTHYFHNGLAPVLTDDGWCYITTDGRLIDYGHMFIFDYSEGYAAFADFVGGTVKVGYMDVYGNTVLPAKYDLFDFGSGRVGTGRVINGNVLVYSANTNSWHQIDLSGQLVEKTMTGVDGDTIYSDWFGNSEGVRFANVVIEGEERQLAFSEGYALIDGYIVKGAGATGGITPPDTPPAEPPAPSSKLEVFINDRYITYNTDVGIFYGCLVTNHTGEKVSGYYALMIYDYDDSDPSMLDVVQFFPMDLDLEDGKSASFDLHSMYTGLSRQNMCWIKFDSLDERNAFLNDGVITNEYDQHYVCVIDVAWLEAKLGTELP